MRLLTLLKIFVFSIEVLVTKKIQVKQLLLIYNPQGVYPLIGGLTNKALQRLETFSFLFLLWGYLIYRKIGVKTIG